MNMRTAYLWFSCLLASCATGSRFQRPELPAASGYGTPAQAANAGAPAVSVGDGPAERWWQAFGSLELNALVDRAMVNNGSLQASNATLQRARERIAAFAGRRRPQAEVNARIERQEVNLAAFGFDSAAFAGGGNPQFNLYSVGGGVSYDLDLSGRNRSALEQAAAEAEVQLRQTEAAHLTIAGRVVTQVLVIAAIRERIATARVLLDEDQRNLALTEALSAQGQLANDQGVLPELEQQLAEARDLLAILLGESPAELGATDFDLARFALPASVPVALPSTLVHKRPDILQAEAELHAATAAIGVATARLYPDITLGVTTAQAAPHAGDLTSSSLRGYDVFGGLTAPIFNGGTLRAEKRGAEAAARAAAARYRQTVLEAFGQVSDLLAAIANDAHALATQQQAADIASRSLHLSRRSFEVGNSDVLQVLDASRGYQRARLALVDAQARQFVNVARLYVATAGGWQ
jgi:NodT family efflux transporter outer membrane factor (OMF) lipoprotein